MDLYTKKKRFMYVRLNFEGKEGRCRRERENVCWTAAERTICVFVHMLCIIYVYVRMFVHTIVLPAGLLPMSDDGERRLFSSLFFLSLARSSLTQIFLFDANNICPICSYLRRGKGEREKKNFRIKKKGNREEEKKDIKKMDIVHLHLAIQCRHICTYQWPPEECVSFNHRMKKKKEKWKNLLDVY